mgnify:CR=1 FL=1
MTKSYIDRVEEEFDKEFPNPIMVELTIKGLSSRWEANKEIKSFLRKSLAGQAEEIEKLIVDEILICHKENTPTSRLTSLANKIREKYVKK